MSDDLTTDSPATESPPADTTPPPASADVSVAPGWYSVDQQTNTQAYWDGAQWSKRRHWRGTGWVEDSDDPAAAATGGDPAEPRASRYLPPSGQRPPGFPPGSSGYQPSGYGSQPVMTRPMMQTTNGSAIASLVLSILGLFGIGSLLGIIFGYKARREIRASGGYQSGDGLALAGIIIGYVTLILFLVVLGLWIALIATVHNQIDNAERSQPVSQCQADTRSVEIAMDAYKAQKGSFPTPPTAWNAATYTSNYGPLTSGIGGGPYLNVPPATTDYVVEYDSSGNVWVAPPNTFELSFDANQGVADPNACETAVAN